MNKCPNCDQDFETDAELQSHLSEAHPGEASRQMDETRDAAERMMDEGEAERISQTPTV
jgi:hypothetical protein